MHIGKPSIDIRRRFVRVYGERSNGFVEFEFAIGEPEIFVEMILGREEFAEFCTTNAVELLSARDADLMTNDWDWKLSDATQTRFK
ncbi:phenol hydroxylase subunit [Ampullimonas aquatilis]|uniref:phenol hydroxylase subunit n=1 Tax=Ampullimonas aquatilis TaxID=1341549 RepID=UPI003C743775